MNPSNDQPKRTTVNSSKINQSPRVQRKRDNGGLARNRAGIKLSDVEATVEELYDTQVEWYGSMKRGRRAELLRQIFHDFGEAMWR